jgi:predicted ATPase
MAWTGQAIRSAGLTNAAAITEITDRLGGLPLAIELAAARMKLPPAEAILARLVHSLGLLVSDRWDVPTGS